MQSPATGRASRFKSYDRTIPANDRGKAQEGKGTLDLDELIAAATDYEASRPSEGSRNRRLSVSDIHLPEDKEREFHTEVPALH